MKIDRPNAKNKNIAISRIALRYPGGHPSCIFSKNLLVDVGGEK